MTENYRKVFKLNPTAANKNESETKEFKRIFEIPKSFKTISPIERNPLDSHPDLKLWVKHISEYSLMNEERYKKAADSSIFAALMFPFCSDLVRYEMMNKLMFLIAILDDHTECVWGDVARNYDRSIDIWQQAIQAFNKIENPDQFISIKNWKPYIVMWFGVFEQICHELKPVSKARLLNLARRYCQANIEETEQIEKNQFIELDDFIEHRGYSISVYMMMALLEYGNDITLTEDEWNDQSLQKFMRLAADNIVYNNDVMSFEKEWVDENGKTDLMYNTVARIVTERKVSIEEAMLTVAELCMVAEREAHQLRDELMKQDMSEAMKKFIQGVILMMGGNFQVGYTIDRYNTMHC